MKFNLVDIEGWARKEHYEHYINDVRCTYSCTVNIDITEFKDALKKRGLKAYPVQIYMISKAVNEHKEFRMSLDENNKLGYWETVNPFYTSLNKESETFSDIWTMHNDNFTEFYKNCCDDIAKYTTGKMISKPNIPENSFNISSIPWLDFSAFNLNIYGDGKFLLPIFTIGKYIEQNERTLMPLAIQVHHAVCDGLHLGKFVETLRDIAVNYSDWL